MGWWGISWFSLFSKGSLKDLKKRGVDSGDLPDVLANSLKTFLRSPLHDCITCNDVRIPLGYLFLDPLITNYTVRLWRYIVVIIITSKRVGGA